jgi:transcriptional regulator with XRE-family HTH domain
MSQDIIERLRQTLTDCPLSIYKIAQESGVNQSQLHRFLNSERDLSLQAAARLARWAGLELRPIEQEPRS